MLMAVAAAYRADADAAASHLFKISARRAQTYRVGSTLADVYTAPGSAQEIAFLGELAWWASSEDQLSVTHDLESQSLICVPIASERVTYAVIVVQHPQNGLDTDDRQRWMEAATLVGQTVASWSTRAVDGALAAMARRLPAYAAALAADYRLEHGLTITADTLGGVVPFDYISLSSLGTAHRHEDRVAFLASSRRIIESRRGWPIAESTTHRLLNRAEALITPDLAAADGEHGDEPWERRLGMRSRLILPIRTAGRIVGTLTLASKVVAAYGDDEVSTLAPLCTVLCTWLAGRASMSRLNHAERVQSRLAELSTSGDAWPGEEKLLRDIVGDLPVSGLRVFKLDDEGSHLHEVTTAGRLAETSLTSRVPLARTPWHRWALESQRMLSVNQSDPEAMMSQPESELALTSRFKTACLIPIVHDGHSLGVLDAIEERHPDRSSLNAGDHMLLASLADTIGRHWAEQGSRPTATAEVPGSLTAQIRMLNRDIINPLTAIIGSVELMRYKSAPISPDCQKYMSAIERAAARIHDAVRSVLSSLDDNGNGNGHRSGETEPSMARWSANGRNDGGDRGLLGFARPASMRDAAAGAERREDDAATSTTGDLIAAE
jgi:GAF domain-containing protein